MENRDISIDIDKRELDIISSLNRHDVRYLIVGGHAMKFHGDENRLVNDLDIWIDNEGKNASKCFEALQVLMPNPMSFTHEWLLDKGRKIDLRGSHYDVEIFTSMEGAVFDESFSRRCIFDQDGEPVSFVGVQDLLKIKKNAYAACRERREKEGKDIEFLESIITHN